MAEISDIVDALRQEMRNHDFDVERFERKLERLSQLGAAEIIRPLLSVFSDTFTHQEALFSVVHLIESFDTETYVRELLAGLPDLAFASREWLGVLVHRICNDPVAYAEFLRQARMPENSSVQSTLRIAASEMQSSFASQNSERFARDLDL